MTKKQFLQLFADHPLPSVAVVLVGVALIGYAILGIGNCNFRRGVEKDKQAIADKQAEIAPLQEQIDTLNLQLAEKKGELRILEENAAETERLRLEAANNSNQAAANVNVIETKDFNGTSFEESQRQRCKAGFVEACK